jgi:uncharacterized coiled-coil DUF342 family protein
MDHAKYSELMKQINEVNLAITMLEENTRKRRESEAIGVQAENAYKKLKERKRLTFEEFKH